MQLDTDLILSVFIAMVIYSVLLKPIACYLSGLFGIERKK